MESVIEGDGCPFEDAPTGLRALGVQPDRVLTGCQRLIGWLSSARRLTATYECSSGHVGHGVESKAALERCDLDLGRDGDAGSEQQLPLVDASRMLKI